MGRFIKAVVLRKSQISGCYYETLSNHRVYGRFGG